MADEPEQQEAEPLTVTTVPKNQKIFHITHVNNLPGVVRDQVMWSDAACLAKGQGCQIVGISRIKQRRLMAIDVTCHQGTKVGEYVPFYFCPRSVMLYILYRGNHPDIDYQGGQELIVHLQADLAATVAWAESSRVRWAFSNGNAGAFVTTFYSDLSELDRVDWSAVQAADWRDPAVKERKQAEFLVYESFPWQLVEKIGVASTRTASQVNKATNNANHQPVVKVERGWYY